MRFSPRPTSTSSSRLESQHLAADFRADAAAGPGDHDRSAFQQLADHLGVQLHRGAPQEVADFDVADGDAMVAAEAIFEAADDLQVQARLLAVVHQVPQPRTGQGAGDHQHVGRLARRRRFRARLPVCPGSGICPSRDVSADFVGAQKASDAIGHFAGATGSGGPAPRGNDPCRPAGPSGSWRDGTSA